MFQQDHNDYEFLQNSLLNILLAKLLGCGYKKNVYIQIGMHSMSQYINISFQLNLKREI